MNHNKELWKLPSISTFFSEFFQVAKRIVNGKATMAAVGNLKNTPCLAELYK